MAGALIKWGARRIWGGGFVCLKGWGLVRGRVLNLKNELKSFSRLFSTSKKISGVGAVNFLTILFLLNLQKHLYIRIRVDPEKSSER